MLGLLAWIARDELQNVSGLEGRVEESDDLTFSMFIHPPKAEPRRMIGLPSLPTTLSPSTLSIPVDILETVLERKKRMRNESRIPLLDLQKGGAWYISSCRGLCQ